MTGYAGSRCEFYAGVLCTELATRAQGRSLPRQVWDHLFQWDVRISVEFFTETTGSLRNLETRRTPSYIQLGQTNMAVLFR